MRPGVPTGKGRTWNFCCCVERGAVDCRTVPVGNLKETKEDVAVISLNPIFRVTSVSGNQDVRPSGSLRLACDLVLGKCWFIVSRSVFRRGKQDP